MGLLAGKKILLGVSGSIAAYKSAIIIRELVKAGAEVKVILTPASLDFITPLTLATLSKNPVLSDLVADRNSGEWSNHVELGLWADLMLIAPASANTMAHMAQGEADNLLLTTYLSARCPVYFAPAMDLDMYAHASTTENISQLQSRGNILIDAAEGELASGLSGKGRMAEPEEIIAFLEEDLRKKAPLTGKTVMVTAGPTHEAIDPVRFIGNHSSGKMGYALAQKLRELGARVVLVSGPVALAAPRDVERIMVTTAAEMLEACLHHFPHCDAAILAAAVADFRPRFPATSKIKKNNSPLSLELEPTTDILKTLGSQKENKLLVGFALETDNEVENARKKLLDKNCDFIVLNSLKTPGAAFAGDTNKVTIISRNNMVETQLKNKIDIATDIVNHIFALAK